MVEKMLIVNQNENTIKKNNLFVPISSVFLSLILIHIFLSMDNSVYLKLLTNSLKNELTDHW